MAGPQGSSGPRIAFAAKPDSQQGSQNTGSSRSAAVVWEKAKMVLGGLASQHVARWLQHKSSSPLLRHPGTGEAAPLGERYHRETMPDEDWWLRECDRGKELVDPPFTYYNPNPLSKTHFQAQNVGPNHSRRVTNMLGRQGHSFSEANLQVLKEDENARQHMAQKYKELMRPASLSPSRARSTSRPPAESPALRESSVETAQDLVDSEPFPPPGPPPRPQRGRSASRKREGKEGFSATSPVKLPKSEHRRTMTGKSIIVLPNPRLPIAAADAMEVHVPNHRIHGRPRLTQTLDNSGERILM